MTVHEHADVNVFANQPKALALGLFGGGGLLMVAFLDYFVWPTPDVNSQPWMYQEPYKTLLFAACTLAGAFVLLIGMYWALIPSPMLHLDAEKMVYQRYPFIRRSFRWTDTDTIHVIKTTIKPQFHRVDRLMIEVDLKPHAVSAYGGKPKLTWAIGKGLMPMSFEEVVRLMRRYHKVTFADEIDGRII